MWVLLKDQTSGADGTMAISNPPGAPLPPGEEKQGSPDWRGVPSTEAGTWATGPGMMRGASKGGLEPGECGGWPGEPQPRPGKGGPTAQERKAPAPPRAGAEPDGGGERGTPPLGEEPPRQEGDYGAKAPAPLRVAAERDGGGERGNPPLVEEPPGQEGDYSAEEVAGTRGAEWECGGDRRAGSAGQPPAKRGATSESPGTRQRKSDPGCRGSAHGGGRKRERRARRAEGPTVGATCSWILLALGLWGILQVGVALVLKGGRERREVFARPCRPFRAQGLRGGADQGGQRDDH